MFRPFAAPSPVIERGDPARTAALRGAGERELAVMRQVNTDDLRICSRTLILPDGSRVVCRREFDREWVTVYAPFSRGGDAPGSSAPRGRPAREGSFYVIPGCVARYDGLGGKDGLGNNIPDGDLAGWSLGLGVRTGSIPMAGTGLPEPAPLPGGSGLDGEGRGRNFTAFSLPGGSGSGLLYADGHIPRTGAFSVSCMFRLNEVLAFDYGFEEKGILSPILARVLLSDDGDQWTWDCPGSLSPLLGFCSPQMHGDWLESVTYPWAPWNEHFAAQDQSLRGARRIDSRCPGAPLLEGAAYVDARGAAYPHPAGFVTGVQSAGLFIYDGNRLMASKISDFHAQYAYPPILSRRLETGVWHFAAMSYEADGETRLYLARLDGADAALEAGAGRQPVCELDEAFVRAASGVNGYFIVNTQDGSHISQFRMNPAMDLAMPRFFHHALSPDQAELLFLEAAGEAFVADAFEAGELMDKGFTPIVIGREHEG